MARSLRLAARRAVMKSLYLRIYTTVVLVLLLFATVSGWVFHRHIEQERVRAESLFGERMGAQAELIQRSLPGVDAASEDQAVALREWSQRLRLPLALDNSAGARIAASDSFLRRQQEGVARGLAVRLEDGRTLWIMRPGIRRLAGERRPPGDIGGGGGGGGRPGADDPPPFLPFMPPGLQGVGLIIVLAMVFVAVAAGAYPVVRRLTRRLESLKQGVDQFGAGQLNHRVEVSGRDEVAAVAASFNVAAARIEALVRSRQSLLANASHELRSPLARLKMAVSMLADASPEQNHRLKTEIDTNVAELDALVEEVLLASRLDAAPAPGQATTVDLFGIAVEEAARVDVAVAGAGLAAGDPDRDGFDGSATAELASAGPAGSVGYGSTPTPTPTVAPFSVVGEERLLRRALRNLLENARRYGGDAVLLTLETRGDAVLAHICDRGPGVPEEMRERIFEPFFRLPGHAEQVGGVGLGLSLVKQIAERHGGSVRCEARTGGGSCFSLQLPRAG